MDVVSFHVLSRVTLDAFQRLSAIWQGSGLPYIRAQDFQPKSSCQNKQHCVRIFLIIQTSLKTAVRLITAVTYLQYIVCCESWNCLAPFVSVSAWSDYSFCRPVAPSFSNERLYMQSLHPLISIYSLATRLVWCLLPRKYGARYLGANVPMTSLHIVYLSLTWSIQMTEVTKNSCVIITNFQFALRNRKFHANCDFKVFRFYVLSLFCCKEPEL